MKHLLISVDELKQKRVFSAWIGNQEVMALMTSQGVRVYSGMCPHQGGPLGDSRLENDKIRCPWHGCEFEVTGGGCTDIGACRNVSGMHLKPLEFKVEPDDKVYVELS
jgi:nitrite reductase/ring-hydroxylating ferredoxin subunit